MVGTNVDWVSWCLQLIKAFPTSAPEACVQEHEQWVGAGALLKEALRRCWVWENREEAEGILQKCLVGCDLALNFLWKFKWALELHFVSFGLFIVFFDWQRLSPLGHRSYLGSIRNHNWALKKKKSGLKKEIKLKGIYMTIFVFLVLGFLIWNNLGGGGRVK